MRRELLNGGNVVAISVITPSFNQGKYIDRTIQSVICQNIPDLEYVVIDNQSNDQTHQILRKYEKFLSWESEPDKGQAHAVNKGILRTQGDVIGWLNSDDVYYPAAIKTVLNHFGSHPDVDIVYGMADHIDEKDQWIEDYPTEAWDFERLKEVCYLCQPAVFFRRNIIDRFGSLNEKLHYCMDYEFWLRAGKAGAKFTYLPVKLAGSRLYQETKTMGSRGKFHMEINNMFLELFGNVPDQWLFNYAHAILDERNIPRTDRIRFPFLVGTISLFAALRWNKSISPKIRGMSWIWIRGAVHNFFQGEK